MIQGLTDQVSQLKIMLDNAEKMFTTPFEEPQDLKRTAAYMLDTDTPLEALRPAIAATTVAGENERVVDLTGNGDGNVQSLGTSGKMYVQDLDNITSQMKEVHWEALRLIVESGVSELSVARKLLIEKLTDENEPVSTDKSFRILKQLVTLMLFSQIKVSTGMRWFMVLNLTDVGTRLYVERYRKPPAETEYQRIVREHENAEHGYIIKDVCQILRDTGRYRSVSMSRRGNTIQLPEGRSCIPDIVCCLPNGIEYYEVECGNHHQSDFSEKCNKLKGITQNLFFVTPNRETTEKKLKPQIEQWIKECGRSLLAMSGIIVYLTSISELAAQRWTYVFDMKKESPIYTAAPASKKK